MHMAVDADDLLAMGGNRSQIVRYHAEQIVALIEEAVEFRNELFVRANHPADKKNKSLVRKHYAQMRRDMMSRVDAMFEKLSGICK